MTQKLEALFDLPATADVDDEISNEPEITEVITTEALNNLEKIDQALPAINGLEAADKEMDDIAELAISSYKDLMALGMNIEARVATEILGSASQFLGHAITAKNAKINKKLKMLDIMLKKAKLDQDSGNQDSGLGTGKMLDRNELLAEVLKANQAQKDKDKDNDKNE